MCCRNSSISTNRVSCASGSERSRLVGCCESSRLSAAVAGENASKKWAHWLTGTLRAKTMSLARIDARSMGSSARFNSAKNYSIDGAPSATRSLNQGVGIICLVSSFHESYQAKNIQSLVGLVNRANGKSPLWSVFSYGC